MKVTLHHTGALWRIDLGPHIFFHTPDAQAAWMIVDLCKAMNDDQLLDFFHHYIIDRAKVTRQILIGGETNEK